jgi:hypothetical protein
MTQPVLVARVRQPQPGTVVWATGLELKRADSGVKKNGSHSHSGCAGDDGRSCSQTELRIECINMAATPLIIASVMI